MKPSLPMPITPDDKNWTWVLERRCPECGFDASGFPREQVGAMLRENAADWLPLLADLAATERPNDHTWSALEYGCHVRDVFRLFTIRLTLMLDEDDPLFANWDQDATAVEDRYAEQEPATVAAEIGEAAEVLAQRFDGVTGDQWDRVGRRSDGATFTVESFARYLVHDPIHHVWDAQRGLSDLAERMRS